MYRFMSAMALLLGPFVVFIAYSLGWARFAKEGFSPFPLMLVGLALALLTVHFLWKMPANHRALAYISFSLVVWGLLALVSLGSKEVVGITYLQAAEMLLFYGISLFVLLSEVLMLWGAALLTRLRGEKWVKEFDYLYLALGTVGILGTLARVDKLLDRVSQADIIGPIILITAVVVRVIKTRADIGGWNKPAAVEPRPTAVAVE
jgi:hypothetical protein